MNYDEAIRLVSFLNYRMHPLRWYLWPNVTWDKCLKWGMTLGWKPLTDEVRTLEG